MHYYIIPSAKDSIGFDSKVECIVAFAEHLITLLQYYRVLGVGGGFEKVW